MTSSTLLTIIITILIGYIAIQLFVFKKLRKLAKHIKSLRTVQKNSAQQLSALNESDSLSTKSLLFDNKTQIYVNDGEGRKIDHKFNLINDFFKYSIF